jgi:archaemetzincin
LIDQGQYRIAISPIGRIDSGLAEAISAEVQRTFGYRTEVVPVIDRVDFAFDFERRQYCSTLILERLAAAASAQAIKLLGIATVDLFIPILTYVYGEAQIGGKACIISTHRLNEGISLAGAGGMFHDRAVKEALHELGHTFKLTHCPDRSCIMHYCRSIQDVDRKSTQLCRHCHVLLTDELKRLGTEKRGCVSGSLESHGRRR